MTELSIDERYERIIAQIKEYEPNADLALVEKAWRTACRLHSGALRDSGEPYIIHPLSVAETLAELKMDEEAIAAGFLHDLVEDVEDYSLDRLREDFGENVAFLVDGLTKLSDDEYPDTPVEADRSEEGPVSGARKRFHPKAAPRTYSDKKAENIRKIFFIMNQDLRVMVIKLADRLHNMRTLDAIKDRNRRIRIAGETIQIFAPIADKLGINSVKAEMEDLSFKYLYPEEYEELAGKLAKTKEERQEILDEAVRQVSRVLEQRKFNVEIQARAKNLWSIRNKIVKDNFRFEDIYDLLAIRVIIDTDNVNDCYTVMGIIHDLWPPIPRLFSDYIANPKTNNYQSLHTKVVALDGSPLEVQIRTREMHKTAEMGVAAHWQYKERLNSDVFEQRLSWLRQAIYNWEKDAGNTEEFMDNITNDLFKEQVVVFTPRGDVMDLVIDSTPVDFAYKIHSDVGDHCVKAKVNGIEVRLDHSLSNADVVEIITAANAVPSLDWLNIVKTSTAKNRIKQYFRRKYSIENEEKGRELLLKELSRQHLNRNLILDEELQKRISAGLTSIKDIFAAIGCRAVSPGWLINRLKAESARYQEEAMEGTLTVSLDGKSEALCSRARCCDPLPGEETEAYKTREKGYVIHSRRCPNLARYKKENPDRVHTVSWEASDRLLPCRLLVKAERRIGKLRDVCGCIADSGSIILDLALSQPSESVSDIHLTCGVRDMEAMNAITESLKALDGILGVARITRVRNKEFR
ncbi:MAG: bifunctional (p)ppGpp synthetase/guanosine-3',5'-bis(diphosphate) 3'-pyrophosphohydrolase [Abditibacteriota bacterium]|nr:bifunctional (p)ppGpp synthetase/guanosine-3',5'-bis(diphosphate) 3'-pyrophosphohydrolase [Abditibacteriota bacterium]